MLCAPREVPLAGFKLACALGACGAVILEFTCRKHAFRYGHDTYVLQRGRQWWSSLRQLGRLARADLMVSIKAGRAEPDEDRERGHGGDQVDDLADQHAVRITPQW